MKEPVLSISVKVILVVVILLVILLMNIKPNNIEIIIDHTELKNKKIKPIDILELTNEDIVSLIGIAVEARMFYDFGQSKQDSLVFIDDRMRNEYGLEMDKWSQVESGFKANY